MRPLVQGERRGSRGEAGKRNPTEQAMEVSASPTAQRRGRTQQSCVTYGSAGVWETRNPDSWAETPPGPSTEFRNI